MEMNTVIAIDEPEKKSVFSCFPLERLNILHPARPRQLNLTQIQHDILHTVNTSMVTTCVLLHTRLTRQGMADYPIEQLRKELKRLSEYGYLTKMEFCTPSARSLTKVFALSNQGKDYIRSCGVHPVRTRYVSGLDAIHCKKLLSAQQFLLSQGWEGQAEIGRMVIENVPEGEATKHLFRTHALVQKEDATIFVESVRAIPGAAQDLLDKLKRMDRTLALGNRLNIPLNRQLQVIVCCENYNHMEQIIEAVGASGLGFDFSLHFTNDYDTFHNPEACIYVHRGNRKTLANRASSAVQGFWDLLVG